jgi:hypothetical protein
MPTLSYRVKRTFSRVVCAQQRYYISLLCPLLLSCDTLVTSLYHLFDDLALSCPVHSYPALLYLSLPASALLCLLLPPSALLCPPLPFGVLPS